MGGKSKMGGSSSSTTSKTSSTSQNYRETRTNNQNLQGIYSPVAVPTITGRTGRGNITTGINLIENTQQTDYGAVGLSLAGMQSAIDSIGKSEKNFLKSTDKISRNNAAVAGLAIDSAGNSAKRAVDISKTSLETYDRVNARSLNAVTQALRLTGSTNNEALRILANAGTQFAARTQEATLGALEFADNATRSDTAHSLDNLVKYATLGASVIAITSYLASKS